MARRADDVTVEELATGADAHRGSNKVMGNMIPVYLLYVDGLLHDLPNSWTDHLIVGICARPILCQQ